MSEEHTIARLRAPMPEPVHTPQCVVPMYRNPAVPTVYWAHRARRDGPKGYDSNYCANASTYEIDGQHYCARHAGQIALGILLSGGTAKHTRGPV